MNLNQYISSLQQITADAVNQKREEIYIRNGNALLAGIKNRIQREGKDSAGALMPGYGSRPGYYSKNQFVKKGSFRAAGKTGNRVFKNGSNHKTMYLENGYKQFREVQGRQTAKRDLTLSGDLMLSYVIGTANDAILLGFNQNKQSKKRKGLEDRNGGKIFYATNEEMEAFNKAVLSDELKAVNQIFTP